MRAAEQATSRRPKAKKTAKSMADVARLAKVSKPTVSRALSNSPLVSDETRMRVREVAAQYGYIVNLNAQRLRQRHTNAIALIADLRSFREVGHRDQFGIDLLAGIRRSLNSLNKDMLLCAPEDDERAYRAVVASRHADGIIFMGQGLRDAALRGLASTDTPFVVWGAVEEDQPYCAVGGDNVLGGALVAERFLQMGRRNLLIVGVTDEQLEMKLRRRGFVQAASRYKSAVKVDNLFLLCISHDAARSALDAYLSASKAIPDGIFAASDTVAMGVFAALKERGIRIPDDTSVIGYNDNQHASWCSPTLTTVRQDTRQAGALIVEKLMRLVDGQKTPSSIMNTELIVRES